MLKRIVIDSDSILYRSAYINNHKDDALEEALALDDGGDELDLETAEATDVLDAMAKTFHSMVNDIVREVQVDAKAKGYEVDPTPVLVLTVKGSSDRCDDLEDNFRYEVMNSVEDPEVKGYKHSRSKTTVPDGLLDIYNYVSDLPNAICVGGVEADDVCVYYGLQGHIICALDKDVLQSLPYAYNFGKKQWVEYTDDERRLWFYTQIVTGDSSDGLRGAYRVGAKWCEKNLLATDTEAELWTKVVKAYYTKGQTLEEALATARCVSMTQWTPETGLVYWKPAKKEK